MKFLISLKNKKAILSFKENHQEIASDKTFSENLLPTINKILQKENLKEFPKFIVNCDEESSLISCNIAKATARALNI